MSVESFLQFITVYDEYIIQFTLVGIFGIATALFFVWTKQENEQSSTGGVNSDQIAQLEETLRKVIAQSTPGGGAVASIGPDGELDESVLAANAAELQELKSSLESKEKELIEIKQKIESGELSSSSGGDAADLEAKIKDLEARLQEYEIIEDDIADLSMYKEENQKLKEELDALKAGGAVPAAKPPKAEEVKSDDLVAEFAEAVGEEPPVADTAPAPEEESAPEPIAADNEEGEELTPNADGKYITDDVLAEFSTAVNEEFAAMGMAPPKAAPSKAPAAEAPPEPVEEPPIEASPPDENVVEEFAEDELEKMLDQAVEEEKSGRSKKSGGDAVADAPEAAPTSQESEPEQVVEAPVEATAANEVVEEEIEVSPEQAAIDALLDEGLAAKDAEADQNDDESGESEPAVEAKSAEESTQSTPSGAASAAKQSDVDTDRMLEEMAALTEAAEKDDGSESALEADADIDKMAEEASKL
ncbi:MAG: hypothetical protein R2827_04860 [Bdellovibrionales bacterium]